MKRLFGMIPASEVDITKHFKDENGYKISIDAGKHGWTIRYADYSSQYEDVEGTAEENFERAYKVLKSQFENLVEIVSLVTERKNNE